MINQEIIRYNNQRYLRQVSKFLKETVTFKINSPKKYIETKQFLNNIIKIYDIH